MHRIGLLLSNKQARTMALKHIEAPGLNHAEVALVCGSDHNFLSALNLLDDEVAANSCASCLLS